MKNYNKVTIYTEPDFPAKVVDTLKTDCVFCSPPMRIGKTWWRYVVAPSRYGGFCTDYQFIKVNEFVGPMWAHGNEHPKFNGNDSYLGLPKNLKRLFDLYKDEYYSRVSAV